jgi:hypothetical protein
MGLYMDAEVNKLDDPPLYFCDITIFWNKKNRNQTAAGKRQVDFESEK